MNKQLVKIGKMEWDGIDTLVFEFYGLTNRLCYAWEYNCTKIDSIQLCVEQFHKDLDKQGLQILELVED